MSDTAPPVGVRELEKPTPDQIAAAATNLPAIHTIEACIAAHHVAEVGYVNEQGTEETLRVRPAFIRTSTRGHIVVWARIDQPDAHWVELRVDRVQRARDTGEEFQPDW